MNVDPEKPRTEQNEAGFAALFMAVGFATLMISTRFHAPWFGAIVFFGALWVSLVTLMGHDKKPWEASRFALSVLVAWSADSILFWRADVSAPSSYRHLAAGIVVVSVLLGYLAWRLSEQDLIHSDPQKRNPFASFGAFLAAIFIMISFVSPIMHHFMSAYWDQAF